MSPISTIPESVSPSRDEARDLRRLTWALSAYGQATAILVRTDEVEVAIAKVCEAIVTQTSYVLAAVGLAEHSEGKPLRIAGRAGTASPYFDGLTLSWSADRPEGRGPSGIGIRTGQASIIRDSLTDPVFEPWRDRARRFGIRSSVTVPFARGGVVLGAVIVYASEPDAFGREELEVFQRLGDELALAMAMDADRKRLAESESARQASEARYERLFNAAASGIVVLTPEGQYTHANPAMHLMLGYAPAEIVGLWATDLVAPDEHALIDPALAEIERGAPYERVWRFRRKTGEILTAEVTATVLPDRNIIAIIRDITPQVTAERNRQAAEQALRESEARYRSLFNNAPEGMVLISQEGPYLDVNPSACRMLGYAREDLIGKTGRDLVDEAQFHFLFEAAEEIARHGVTRRRWRLKRADGTWLAAEVVSTQLPDGPYMSVITDLTDRDAMEAARSAAETALRQSEARYRGLFDHAPDGIIVMNPEGVFLDVNASACEILGYRPDTLLSRTVRDIIAPDDEAHLEAGVQAIAAMGVHRRSGHLRRADGDFVAVEVITTRIPNGCYVSIIRDMSERDRIEAARSAAETALRQSEGRYRGLFDHAPDGIIVNSEAGPYIDINPSACQMLGYDRNEFIGLNVQDLVGEAQANLHAQALTSLATKGVFRASWRARRKDGSWVPTDVVTTQMPDKTYISIIRDVTERDAVEAARTAAETALRESEARYRSLFDHAPDGIIVLSETGSYLDINPSACAMLGYRREDFIGLHGPDIVGKDQLPLIEEAANAIAAEGVYRAAWRLRHKGGSWVPTDVVTTQMPDKTYISIIRDVTERDRIESARQAAEEALRETQAKLARAGRAAALGEVVATISHEINQPLAAIVTNSDAAQRWLSRNPPDLDATRESLTHIARDSRRASQVIRRTREFLAGKGLERAAFDLNIALEEVVALSRTEQRRAGVVTRLMFAPDLPPVDADRTQIQQVALNLILNALDAMGPTEDTVRRLTVSTSRFDGDWALVEVEDCGPGLEPNAAEQIFEQFFTTKAQGTGVGLAISRSIIDAHGGRIWAAQAATGGAVFRFTVPLSATGSA